jgi:hypothetical protein
MLYEISIGGRDIKFFLSAISDIRHRYSLFRYRTKICQNEALYSDIGLIRLLFRYRIVRYPILKIIATNSYTFSAAPYSGWDFDVVNVIISVAELEPKGAATIWWNRIQSQSHNVMQLQ